jgi:hypothetical protein
MQLSEQIADFKDFAGRDELSDDQVKRLLNRGIEFLMPMISGYLAESYTPTVLPAGRNMIEVSSWLMSVRKIYYMNPDDSIASGRAYREMVQYFDLADFIEDFPTQTGTGTPTSFVVMAALPPQEADDTSVIFDAGEMWTAAMFGNLNAVNILFSTAPEENIDLRIVGKRRINKLNESDDYNWLTVHTPELLNHAALYFLLMQQRQYKGAADLQMMIDRLITTLNVQSSEEDAEKLGNQIDG